jgi:hypothetical protein
MILCALAGKSTLNRVEHTPKRHGAKYHKWRATIKVRTERQSG